MQTGFSHTLDELMRINGNSSNDLGIARAAADELKDFVESQHKIIDDFTQLRSVVTCTSDTDIKSALAAMRHVTSALKDLSEFHSNGLLASSFEAPFLQANEVLKKAEKQVSALLVHFGPR